jgi:aromatase
MSGYTENRIVVLRDFDFTFDLTNRIDLWPQLFTEYKEAQILENNGNYIKFQLTTYAEGKRPSRSWVSERRLDKKNHLATAERIEPKFPFEYMQIRWEYEVLPSDQAVIMTWIQEFDVHPECPFNREQMEGFLNRNTHKQLKAVKQNVESWKAAL